MARTAVSSPERAPAACPVPFLKWFDTKDFMALYNLGYNGFQPGRYKDEQRREHSATPQCGKGRSVRFMNMRTAMRNLFFGLLILGTAGCTVGHDYRKPEASVPENWSRPPADEQTAAQVDLNTWWTIFQDPELDSLLERAVRTNKDLKLAEARIRESRALRSSASAAQFPTINTSANYTRYRHSDNTPGATPASPWYDLYQGGFDASWEIDIFGGLRRAVEATGADLDASVENRRDLLLVASDFREVFRNETAPELGRAGICSTWNNASLFDPGSQIVPRGT